MTEEKNIFGNIVNTDIQGNPTDKNIQGQRPEDIHGNSAKDIYGNPASEDNKA